MGVATEVTENLEYRIDKLVKHNLKLRDQVDSLEAQVAGDAKDLANLYAENKALHQTINTLEGENASLREQVKELKEREWING